MRGDAEESLRTDKAKISDKAPPSHEIQGGQIKKGMAQTANALAQG